MAYCTWVVIIIKICNLIDYSFCTVWPNNLFSCDGFERGRLAHYSDGLILYWHHLLFEWLCTWQAWNDQLDEVVSSDSKVSSCYYQIHLACYFLP